jgi:hypothetical protein
MLEVCLDLSIQAASPTSSFPSVDIDGGSTGLLRALICVIIAIATSSSVFPVIPAK